MAKPDFFFVTKENADALPESVVSEMIAEQSMTSLPE